MAISGRRASLQLESLRRFNKTKQHTRPPPLQCLMITRHKRKNVLQCNVHYIRLHIYSNTTLIHVFLSVYIYERFTECNSPLKKIRKVPLTTRKARLESTQFPSPRVVPMRVAQAVPTASGIIKKKLSVFVSAVCVAISTGPRIPGNNMYTHITRERNSMCMYLRVSGFFFIQCRGVH